MSKRRKRIKRIPDHIQAEIDATPLSAEEEAIGELAIGKALAMGLMTHFFGSLVPTAKGRLILAMCEKPEPWYGSAEEELALLLIVANDFENPLGGDDGSRS